MLSKRHAREWGYVCNAIMSSPTWKWTVGPFSFFFFFLIFPFYFICTMIMIIYWATNIYFFWLEGPGDQPTETNRNQHRSSKSRITQSRGRQLWKVFLAIQWVARLPERGTKAKDILETDVIYLISSITTAKSQRGALSDYKRWTATLQSDSTTLWAIRCWVIIVQALRITRSSDWGEDIALTLQPKPLIRLPSEILPTTLIDAEPMSN